MKEVVSLDSDKEIVVRLIYSNKDSISTGINNFDLKHKLTEINFEKENNIDNNSKIDLEKLKLLTAIHKLKQTKK